MNGGEKMEDLSLISLRSYGYFDPVKQRTPRIIVYGAGSVGSHVVYALSKIGANSIKVIDFDKVEIHNIGNQFYKLSDINKLKAEALKENIKEFSAKEIEIDINKVTEETELEIATDTIHIITVDNMETRKVIFDKLKGFPVTLIDARAGGEGWQIFEVKMDEEVETTEFAKTLEGTFSEALCGFQSVCFNVLNLASEVCSIFKKIENNQPRPRKIRREMSQFEYLKSQNK